MGQGNSVLCLFPNVLRGILGVLGKIGAFSFVYRTMKNDGERGRTCQNLRERTRTGQNVLSGSVQNALERSRTRKRSAKRSGVLQNVLQNPFLRSVAFWNVLVLAVLLWGISVYQRSNFYVYGWGLIHCTDEYTCLHEAGHRLDDELGNISRSKEFGDFLKVYVATHLDGDLEKNWLAYRILTYDGILNYSEQYYSGRERLSNPIQELYADIYGWFDGDITAMPVEFRRFYE